MPVRRPGIPAPQALRHPKLGIEAVRRIVTLATRDKPIGARLLERRHNAVAQRRMTAIGG